MFHTHMLQDLVSPVMICKTHDHFQSEHVILLPHGQCVGPCLTLPAHSGNPYTSGPPQVEMTDPQAKALGVHNLNP